MLRNRVSGGGRVGARPFIAPFRGVILSAIALALGVALIPGCGEQDLYKPPKSPYQVTGQVKLASGAEDVAVLGHFAFLAGGEAGLVVVDISNPTAPQIVGQANTSKSAVGIKVASTPSAVGVFDYAYVADPADRIAIFDVGDPANPVWMSANATPYDPNSVFIDISNDPSIPFSVYVADSWRGISHYYSTPDLPGSITWSTGRTFTLGSAQSVAVTGEIAYVADDEMGVTVVDARIPVAMQVVSNCDTDGFARAICLKGGYAFVADGKDGLIVMSIHGTDKPVIVGHLLLPGDCRSIMVRDNYCFIAAQDGGAHIIDVTVPSSPQLLGTVVTPYATGVALTDSGYLVVSDRTGLLYVLNGPARLTDVIRPANVVSLTASARSSASIQLEWRAPGDDLYNGTAARYDIRIASTPITDESWGAATPVQNPPAPSRPGTLEQLVVGGLDPTTEYFFALKTVDDVSLWSDLSNSTSATTFGENIPPSLTVTPRTQGGPFTPRGAAAGSEFTFVVTYLDPDNDAPTRADLVLGSQTYPMTAQSQDYSAGVVFRVVVPLPEGSYQFHFTFDDGQGHEVSTPLEAGPWVGDIFIMGSPETEIGRDVDEAEHLVRMEFTIRMSPHEVTQEEFERVMHHNPSHFLGTQLPVENVTWYDAIAYCNALSADSSLTPAYTVVGGSVTWNKEANGFRLPTEAEWERMARAGSNTAFPTGNLTLATSMTCLGQPDPVLDPVGWYCVNSGRTTHDVMSKQAGPNSMYDMHGNVWEWCWDWYSETGTEGEMTGPVRGDQRAIRGGSWDYFAGDCRSAARKPYWPNSKDDIVGFRVCRTIP
jgi:formylglycine-generating enzyme required for sulfatase activity